ncbi:MAG: nucleotidyltransferase family protein [Thermodesulfobacteriota bacterium]
MSLSDITAVILAGGKGTRLQAVLADRPKVLAPVCGRPFLAYLLHQWEGAGGRRVLLSTGYMAEKIRAVFGESYGNLQLTYSTEDEPLGTGGALRLTLEREVSDPFLVMNGDSLIQADFNDFYQWFTSAKREAGMILTQVPDAGRFGKVVVGENGLILHFEEKNPGAGAGWINAGVYLLTHRLVRAIPPARFFSLERELFPQLAGHSLYGYQCPGEFIDIGTPETWQSADQFFAKIFPAPWPAKSS